MKTPGFAIHIHLHGLTDPEPGPPISKRTGLPMNPLKLAARAMLKEQIAQDPSLKKDMEHIPTGNKGNKKTTIISAYKGPWDSSTPTQDHFSVNEDPYPKIATSKNEAFPRGLKEKPKPGYYY